MGEYKRLSVNFKPCKTSWTEAKSSMEKTVIHRQNHLNLHEKNPSLHKLSAADKFAQINHPLLVSVLPNFVISSSS